MTTVASRLLLLVAILSTIGCDRVTKRWATESLAPSERHSYFGDTIRLQYAENSGAFLSLGASWPVSVRRAVFTFGAGGLLLGLAVVATTTTLPTLATLGIGLIVAGGASNIVDRIVSGAVVDFVNLGIGSIRTGIFNVADIAVTIGALTAAFGFGRRRKDN